jgi:hypothetical protein
MVVNVSNVQLVIIFAHVLIHTVVFVVKINDLLVMVYNQNKTKTFHYFNFLGNTPAITPAATTASGTCSSNLCNNRGTCQQNGYGIQCFCLTGFTGSRCQYSK